MDIFYIDGDTGSFFCYEPNSWCVVGVSVNKFSLKLKIMRQFQSKIKYLLFFNFKIIKNLFLILFLESSLKKERKQRTEVTSRS